MNAPTDWYKDFFSGVWLDLWRRAIPEAQSQATAELIEKVLRLPPRARVLDVPCGHGRLALPLAARGHDLTGVDLSAEDLDEGRARAAARQLAVIWKHGDMRDLPWESAFDGAFCFGNSFGYLDDDGTAAFVKAVRRALKPGARFALEVGTTAEGLFPHLQERAWYEFGDLLFLANRRYDPVSGRLEIAYTIVRDGKVETRPISQRVFTFREIARLLTDAGFADVQGFGPDGEQPFRLGTPDLLAVAVRP